MSDIKMPSKEVYTIYSKKEEGFWQKKLGIYSFIFTSEVLRARVFHTERQAVLHLKHVRDYHPDVVLAKVTVDASVHVIGE